VSAILPLTLLCQNQ